MTNFLSREVFDFLNDQKPLQVQSDQQFSKLEIVLKQKTKVDRISIESCAEPFQDGIDFYVNYDEDFRFLEGGRKVITYEPRNKNLEFEALTINFRRNISFCLKKVTFESRGQVIQLVAPKLFAAQLEIVNSSSSPDSLFDSHLNSKILERLAGQGVFVKLKIREPIEMNGLILWSGNSMTDILFKEFSRPKSLEVGCDQKSREIFTIKDMMGPQELKFSRALKCQKMQLKFSGAYPGSETKEFALTELRFLSEQKLFVPDISEYEGRTKKQIDSQFSEAKLPEVLHRQLKSVETPRETVFRIHADGSFFIHGFDELAKENESFYILGTFAAKTLKKNRISLQLTGIKRSSTLEMDSLSCGRKCFRETDFQNDKNYFEQEVLVRKGHDGFYRIDTLTPKNLRRIDFTSVRFLLDHSL